MMYAALWIVLSLTTTQPGCMLRSAMSGHWTCLKDAKSRFLKLATANSKRYDCSVARNADSKNWICPKNFLPGQAFLK